MKGCTMRDYEGLVQEMDLLVYDGKEVDEACKEVTKKHNLDCIEVQILMERYTGFLEASMEDYTEEELDELDEEFCEDEIDGDFDKELDEDFQEPL
jgi:hypothetical protein